MKKLISAKFAGNIILVVLAALGIFHLLLILGIIPQTIAWGGQLENSPDNIVLLELFALIVLLFFALIVSVEIGYLNLNLKFKTVGLWVMFIYFTLNLVGNLASPVLLEKLVFAPVTLVLSLLCLRLILEK